MADNQRVLDTYRLIDHMVNDSYFPYTDDQIVRAATRRMRYGTGQNQTSRSTTPTQGTGSV